jgi:two-component system NtrC family sensor kinase
MDDDKELLKQKAVLLLSRERELFALKNVAKRLQRWLSVAHHLAEFVHRTADDNKVLEPVSRALVSALQFQRVLFFEIGQQGLVPIDSEHKDATCSVPSANEAEQFLRAHPHGACNAPDAPLRPLADAVGLHRFLWHSLSFSDTDKLLLVAGYDSSTAKFYRGFTTEDQAQFHHMGEQLELLLANQRLLHNLAAEKQRLAEFNQELEARVPWWHTRIH